MAMAQSVKAKRAAAGWFSRRGGGYDMGMSSHGLSLLQVAVRPGWVLLAPRPAVPCGTAHPMPVPLMVQVETAYHLPFHRASSERLGRFWVDAGGTRSFSGVPMRTLRREEGSEGVRPTTIAAIRTALEAAGVVFIPENGGGAGVRLRDPST